MSSRNSSDDEASEATSPSFEKAHTDVGGGDAADADDYWLSLLNPIDACCT